MVDFIIHMNGNVYIYSQSSIFQAKMKIHSTSTRKGKNSIYFTISMSDRSTSHKQNFNEGEYYDWFCYIGGKSTLICKLIFTEYIGCWIMFVLVKIWNIRMEKQTKMGGGHISDGISREICFHSTEYTLLKQDKEWSHGFSNELFSYDDSPSPQPWDSSEKCMFAYRLIIRSWEIRYSSAFIRRKDNSNERSHFNITSLIFIGN